MSRESKHQPGGGARSIRAALAALALSAVAAAAFGAWYLNLRGQDQVLSTAVQRLDAEWTTVSAHLDNAKKAQSRFEASLKQIKRITEERDSQGWTAALQSIVASAGADIELRDIHANRELNGPRACALRVDGVSTGPEPRAIAERFRQTLESKLKRQFPGNVTIRFDRLEDEPELPSARPDQRRATFTITTTIGLAEQPKAESNEGL